MSRSNMRRTVGVLVMEHIAVGLVEDHKVLGSLSIFPETPQSLDPLQSMPAEGIVDCIRQQVDRVAGGGKISAIGIGFPGLIRSGVVEDSPNFHQAKGFAMLCHRALAAATATSIHMEGPGMFFVTGPDVRFIDIGLLDRLLHEMVKMSPLQGSRFEVVPTSDEMGIIGAAVNADRATSA